MYVANYSRAKFTWTSSLWRTSVPMSLLGKEHVDRLMSQSGIQLVRWLKDKRRCDHPHQWGKLSMQHCSWSGIHGVDVASPLSRSSPSVCLLQQQLIEQENDKLVTRGESCRWRLSQQREGRRSAARRPDAYLIRYPVYKTPAHDPTCGVSWIVPSLARYDLPSDVARAAKILAPHTVFKRHTQALTCARGSHSHYALSIPHAVHFSLRFGFQLTCHMSSHTCSHTPS